MRLRLQTLGCHGAHLSRYNCCRICQCTGGLDEKTWQVVQHTGESVELERLGELLQIERPIELGARLIFMRLKVGQLVDETLVEILTGKTRTN